jgi:multidrug efflux pump subunit AcrB
MIETETVTPGAAPRLSAVFWLGIAVAICAVIGGLLCATAATLIFVPAVFALLHGRHEPGAPEVPVHD